MGLTYVHYNIIFNSRFAYLFAFYAIERKPKRKIMCRMHGYECAAGRMRKAWFIYAWQILEYYWILSGWRQKCDEREILFRSICMEFVYFICFFFSLIRRSAKTFPAAWISTLFDANMFFIISLQATNNQALFDNPELRMPNCVQSPAVMRLNINSSNYNSALCVLESDYVASKVPNVNLIAI